MWLAMCLFKIEVFEMDASSVKACIRQLHHTHKKRLTLRVYVLRFLNLENRYFIMNALKMATYLFVSCVLSLYKKSYCADKSNLITILNHPTPRLYPLPYFTFLLGLHIIWMLHFFKNQNILNLYHIFIIS